MFKDIFQFSVKPKKLLKDTNLCYFQTFSEKRDRGSKVKKKRNKTAYINVNIQFLVISLYKLTKVIQMKIIK